MTATEPLLVPARDAFRRIGVGRDAGYRLIAEGRLRVIRVGAEGRRLLVPVAEIEAFIERELARSSDPAFLGREVIATTSHNGQRNAPGKSRGR